MSWPCGGIGRRQSLRGGLRGAGASLRTRQGHVCASHRPRRAPSAASHISALPVVSHSSPLRTSPAHPPTLFKGLRCTDSCSLFTGLTSRCPLSFSTHIHCPFLRSSISVQSFFDPITLSTATPLPFTAPARRTTRNLSSLIPS